MANFVGKQLGNYRLLRLIGQGGFADVYLGEHIHLNTQAAIKLLQMRLVGSNLEQFRNEARTIASLIHPNIVRVLDFGVDDGIPFLVMDYAVNGTLRQRHPKGTFVPPATIIPYVKHLASALQYAHDRKLIHRDIKPENMLLGPNNEVLLSDFGLVLIAQSTGSRTTQEMSGTVPYMAPEQLNGKSRPASDQYSLGIVVYEWLSGDRPFSGSFVEIASQHILTPPPPLYGRITGISRALEQVVLTALAKDPQQRFATVQAFATAFEQAAQTARPHPFTPTSLPTMSDESSQSTFVKPIPNQTSQPTVNTPPGQLPQSMAMKTPPDQTFQSTYVTPQLTPPSPVSPMLPPQNPFPQHMVSPTQAGQSLPPTVEMSLPSGSQSADKRGISRRKLVIGLGTLVAVGTTASYLVLSQKIQTIFFATGPSGTATTTYVATPTRSVTPSSSPTPTATPTESPTPNLSPTPKTVPLGTRFVTYRGHTARVGDAEWSPHGMYIASGSTDTTVQIWDPTTGNLNYTYHGHTDIVNALSWSPDGRRIASGGGGINANQGTYDHSIQVWDTATQQKIFTFSDHSDYISAIKWSPDGRRIASSSYDKTVKVIDANTGQLLITYTHHTDAVLDIAWSPDSKRIASAGSFADKTVQVWDAVTGNPIFSYLGHTNYGLVLSVSWSLDGKRIASSSGGNYTDAIVQVWDASTGNTLFTYNGHTQQRALVFWGDLKTKNARALLSNPKRLLSGSGIGVFTVAWSPDNQHIASAGGVGDFTVQVWDASNGNKLATYRGHSTYIVTLAWSPDGTRMASGGDDATVQVWQAG